MVKLSIRDDFIKQRCIRGDFGIKQLPHRFTGITAPVQVVGNWSQNLDLLALLRVDLSGEFVLTLWQKPVSCELYRMQITCFIQSEVSMHPVQD